MTIINSKNNERIADLHDNCILAAGTSEVIGVILGNCVYGKDGSIKGKYIDKTIYTTTGEIIAVEKRNHLANKQIDKATIMQQSWNVITAIKTHICAWVEPKNQWAASSLPEVLTS